MIRVKFIKNITVLARLGYDISGSPQILEEWEFDVDEVLDISSIDWTEPMMFKKGRKEKEKLRFASLNLEELKGYLWMVPENAFVIIDTNYEQ